MTWTITLHSTQEETCTIPFESFQTVYYAHRKKWWDSKSKWVISKCKVTGIWATNTYGVTLSNEEHIAESEFDCLFTDKESAIEFCLKKNAHSKVKIYGE